MKSTSIKLINHINGNQVVQSSDNKEKSYHKMVV